MASTKKKAAWSELLGTGNAPEETSEAGADTGSKEPPAVALMHTVVSNPENPRPEEDYTDDDAEFGELKASMREIGQLQPLAVVSRSVYEQAKPEAVAKLKPKTKRQFREAEWVVVTGNRRLAAARQLGWTRIDIRLQDHLGDEDGRIDDAVIIENIHRKNIAPIREAEFLRRMVAKHGSQDEVARRIGKSQMYVSHRLALLKLAPDLQEQVDAGELKLKDARQLAGKTADHDEQRTRVAEMQRQAAEPKPPREPRRAQVQNPVLNGGRQPGEGSTEQSVPNPRPHGTTDTVAVAVGGRDLATDGELVPWDDPRSVHELLVQRMTRQHRRELTVLLLNSNDESPE